MQFEFFYKNKVVFINCVRFHEILLFFRLMKCSLDTFHLTQCTTLSNFEHSLLYFHHFCLVFLAMSCTFVAHLCTGHTTLVDRCPLRELPQSLLDKKNYNWNFYFLEKIKENNCT